MAAGLPRRPRRTGPRAAAASAARPAARDAAPAARRPVRRAAFDVLLAVAERDAYANLLLPSVLRDAALTGRDAALATELCYGTLRGRGSYDAIIGVCSDRAVDKIDPPVREVLRLGAHQLLATRIEAHAAVATSVDLARDVAGPRPAGFVNAVLRRVATRDLDAWMQIARPTGRPTCSGTSRSGTATRAGSSPRCATRWATTAAGAAWLETEAALAADVAPRVTLARCPAGAGRASWSPAGASPLAGHRSAPTWPRATRRRSRAVREGRAGVQDEASQLAALALARPR